MHFSRISNRLSLIRRGGYAGSTRTVCSFLMSSSKLTVPGRAAVTRSYGDRSVWRYMRDKTRYGISLTPSSRLSSCQIGFILMYRENVDGMNMIYTYRGSRPELARKDSQTWCHSISHREHSTTNSRVYAYRSHKFDSRHFRGLHTHASLMLFLVEGLMGSFYDVRSTGLAGLGFRLPEESDNNGQHEEYDASSTAIWNKCTGSSFE